MIFMTNWHGCTFCSLIIGGARLMHGPFSKILVDPSPPPGSTPLKSHHNLTDRVHQSGEYPRQNFITVWAQEHCKISPSRFLAECNKRWLNQGSFVLLYFALFAFLVYQYQSSYWLWRPLRKTEIVSGGALNSASSPSIGVRATKFCIH